MGGHGATREWKRLQIRLSACRANLSDQNRLYDFDFEAGGIATSAAAVQIGQEFMRTGRDAGRIFFDRADFRKEFDNWEYNFP